MCQHYDTSFIERLLSRLYIYFAGGTSTCDPRKRNALETWWSDNIDSPPLPFQNHQVKVFRSAS